jgi:hypothetical protein
VTLFKPGRNILTHVRTFELDAVLLDALDAIPATLLLPHVLSIPQSHPLDHQYLYALMVSEPLAAEIELGLVGAVHVELLSRFLKTCGTENIPKHCRTDGTTVWVPR